MLVKSAKSGDYLSTKYGKFSFFEHRWMVHEEGKNAILGDVLELFPSVATIATEGSHKNEGKDTVWFTLDIDLGALEALIQERITEMIDSVSPTLLPPIGSEIYILQPKTEELGPHWIKTKVVDHLFNNLITKDSVTYQSSSGEIPMRIFHATGKTISWNTEFIPNEIESQNERFYKYFKKPLVSSPLYFKTEGSGTLI